MCGGRADAAGSARAPLPAVHVIVEWCESAVPAIAQDLIEPALLGFPGEEGNAERLRVAHVLRHIGKHGDATGNVEPADADGQSGGK